VQVISDAIASQDSSLGIAISENRSVRLNQFKNQLLIDIREYYDAGGDRKPGSKGISLTAGQWSDFTSAIPELQAAIDS
jgi:hypothetical protein